MRMSRLLCAFVAVALSMGGTVSAQSDLSKLTPASRSLTLRGRNVTVSDAMHLLSEAAGIEIRVAPEVAALKTEFSFTFKNASFRDVFTSLLEGYALSYSVIDDKTVLVKRTPQV